MKPSADEVLVLLDQAREWAKLAPESSGRPPLQYAFIDDWTELGELTLHKPEEVAVVVDGREFYFEGLESLNGPEALAKIDPSVVIFRLVKDHGSTRDAVAFIRSGRGVTPDMVKGAVGFGVYDPSSAKIRAAASDALAQSSESTRKPSSNE